MDKNRIKGKVDQAKGSVKEGIGHATGNRSTEVSGKIDKVKGKIKQAIGALPGSRGSVPFGGRRRAAKRFAAAAPGTRLRCRSDTLPPARHGPRAGFAAGNCAAGDRAGTARQRTQFRRSGAT